MIGPRPSSLAKYRSCLCCILIWVSLVALLTVAIWFFGYWLDYHRHRHIQFTVDSASLTRFDLDSATGILHHNLSLAVSVRNRDKSTVYYTKLEAAAYFGGSKFASQSLRRFSQWRETTTQIYPAFQGETRLNGSSVLAEFRKGKAEGFYGIEVRFEAEIRVEWDVKGLNGDRHSRRRDYSPAAACRLRMPVNGRSNSSSAVFAATSCDVRF